MKGLSVGEQAEETGDESRGTSAPGLASDLMERGFQ